MPHHISTPLLDACRSYRQHLGRYLAESAYDDLLGKPGVIDLAFGDPHEYPSPSTVETLRQQLLPQHEGWFAYVRDDPRAQTHVADNLSSELGTSFRPDDVLLTSGAFAGLATAFRTVCAPGDEVVYLNPAWFYYESMILASGALPRRVDLEAGSWDLDPPRVAAALTDRTAAVVVNTPNNPTGAVYSAESLRALADLLAGHSERIGRPVYLISDEAYRKIVFDGARPVSPASWYPYTIVVHTYTKTLLLPGERIGYVALPETMPEREVLRDALTTARLVGGWHSPNNSLQYAVPQLDGHRVPLEPLRRRRQLLGDAFQGAGFSVVPNRSTFYLLAATPTADDWAHARLLERHGLLVLPGSVMGAPGYVRISATVTDAMAEQVAARLPAAYGADAEDAS